MKPQILVFVFLLLISCKSQEKQVSSNPKILEEFPVSPSEIADYVTKVFQDSKGNIWFGTLEKGIARYDEMQLCYFTSQDGLPSDRVVSVSEDTKGNLWFLTGNGLSKYSDGQFTNFQVGDSFEENMVSTLLIDSHGIFWIGTWNGVYEFDGKHFTKFDLPFPEVSTEINPDTKGWITGIKEDQQGNIWFTRDGYGACKFDRQSFTHLLKKDGLHSNAITDILCEKNGVIWLGTRVQEMDNPDPAKRHGKGGLNKFVNGEIISFPEIPAFNNGGVEEIYQDKKGNLWISTRHDGVYKYNGTTFRQYEIPISIMSIAESKDGKFWLGGAGGLFRINETGEIIKVLTDGPW